MFFRKEYYFMSNFYPVAIKTQKWGIWLSAEHLYHACKFPKSEEIRQRIREHDSKGLKAFVRTLPGFDKEDWEKQKLPCMRKIVDLKFAQNAFLQRKIVKVKGPILEENTWHDNYWGKCICTRPFCESTRGKNHLGKILEEVRDLYLA